MKAKREIVEIFGRCSRLLNKIALNAGDNFFSRLCAEESDKLLSAFIFFLKGEENVRHVAQNDILQHGDVAKYPQIVQHKIYVAQSGKQLISQIKNIFNLLDILKHLGLTKLPTSLLLERDLLLLELAILDICRPVARPSNKAEEPIVRKEMKTGPRPSPKPTPKLNQAHREILEFIKSRERTQNLEVFGRFGHISRRTIKKKLSDLVKTNTIKRFAAGKKVFYLPV